jgi:hypothetical protein
MIYREPLEMGSHEASRNLAVRLISEYGCTSGEKLLEMIGRSVEERSNGRYRVDGEGVELRGEMSRLIEEFSYMRRHDY